MYPWSYSRLFPRRSTRAFKPRVPGVSYFTTYFTTNYCLLYFCLSTPILLPPNTLRMCFQTAGARCELDVISNGQTRYCVRPTLLPPKYLLYYLLSTYFTTSLRSNGQTRKISLARSCSQFEHAMSEIVQLLASVERRSKEVTVTDKQVGDGCQRCLCVM